MNSLLTVPEVSLITSWYVLPSTQAIDELQWLPSMQMALQAGISLLDLYFLNHADIPWYEKVTERQAKGISREPHEFVASLTTEELDKIADRLRSGLTECYSGRLVGRRPRFAAIATFFPDISLPRGDEDPQGLSRAKAIKALHNSIYLANSLGCHCVEIVGGAGVPGSRYNGNHSPEQYRLIRRESLADALCQVYNFRDASDLDPLDNIGKRSHLPMIALELEPGPSFLVNSLNEFKILRDEVAKQSGSRNSLVFRSLKLNVDIAHAFLIGYEPKALRDMKLDASVIHMHLSDHAGHKKSGGAHASDLVPGEFHFYYDDYRPWLQFAIRRTSDSRTFSKVIAIEMEACNSVSMISCAVNTTRWWLQEAREELLKNERRKKKVHALKAGYKSEELIEGALLVIDIGNSTRILLRGTTGLEGCLRLEDAITKLCSKVHRQGGSVMSFSGDGFIALFEKSQFPGSEVAASKALEVAKEVCKSVRRRGSLTARAALHWGYVYVPTTGRLRDQAIGGDVVIGTRLCDWLRGVEALKPAPKRGVEFAATRDFYQSLPDIEKYNWEPYDKLSFKGLAEDVQIYLLKPSQGP